MTEDSPVSVGALSAGRLRRMAVGWAIVVVKMKNVMSRKPRSTMGVRSMRVERFLDLVMPRGLRLGAGVVMSAMVEWF